MKWKCKKNEFKRVRCESICLGSALKFSHQGRQFIRMLRMMLCSRFQSIAVTEVFKKMLSVHMHVCVCVSSVYVNACLCMYVQDLCNACLCMCIQCLCNECQCMCVQCLCTCMFVCMSSDCAHACLCVCVSILCRVFNCSVNLQLED